MAGWIAGLGAALKERMRGHRWGSRRTRAQQRRPHQPLALLRVLVGTRLLRQEGAAGAVCDGEGLINTPTTAAVACVVRPP